MRPRSPVVLAIGVVVAVAAMAVGVVLALRADDDPYRAGTTHQVQLVNGQPECAWWSVSIGERHVWRITEDVPDGWVSPMAGELRIQADDEAVFEADAGGSVPLWGGDVDSDPPKTFTADCPDNLEGRLVP